jgi:hypothetical protein
MMETKPPKLTEEQQTRLRSNPNVKKVSDKTVQYTPEFKKYFLESVRRGQGANDVFQSAGIPTEWFGKEYATSILRKWRRLAKEHGEAHFDQEHRGHDSQLEYRQLSDKDKVTHLEMKVEALESNFLPPACSGGSDWHNH